MCKLTVKRQLTNVKNKKKSNVQIQRLNDKRLFMQVSTIIREFNTLRAGEAAAQCIVIGPVCVCVCVCVCMFVGVFVSVFVSLLPR